MSQSRPRRFFPTVDQLRIITNHVDQLHETEPPLVTRAWDEFLTNIQALGLPMEDLRYFHAFMVSLDTETMAFLGQRMVVIEGLGLQLYAAPGNAAVGIDTPTPLEILLQLSLFCTAMLSRAVRVYRGLPSFCVMASRFVSYTLQALAALVLVWLVSTLLLFIYEIDLGGVANGVESFVGWIWTLFWGGVVNANASIRRCMTVNWTLPAFPVVNWTTADHHADMRHTFEDERVCQAGPPSSAALDNLTELVSSQSLKHAQVELQMGAHMAVYSQEKTDLQAQIQNLTTMLAAEANHSASLGNTVRALVDKLITLDGVLTTMHRKLERLGNMSQISLIVASATTVVGAGAAILSGAGCWSLVMMAGGYVLTALCEYGSLAVLEP